MRTDRFIRSLSGEMLSCGRYRMSETYCSILHRLEKYLDARLPVLDVVFSRVFLRNFHNHLLSDGLSRNTVSFYMTGLRSIYAFAVQAGKLRADSDLFSMISCGRVPTGKRAVSAETIALLHAADLSDVLRLDRCRDFFMLSFYLQGMPFTDLAHLLKSDVQNGSIAYRRQKTHGVVMVPISEAAQAILDKYAAEAQNSPFLIPLLSLTGIDGHREYQTALRRHNRQLKDLANLLEIQDTLSSYVARHSWATLAYHNGVDVGVVSQAMGHHTEEVTRIYLSSFDRQRLVDANNIVLQAVLRPILEGRISQVREEVKNEVAREFGTAEIEVMDEAVVATITTATPVVSSELSGGCQSVYRKAASKPRSVGWSNTKNVRLCSKDGQ